jgi:septum formation protein
MTKNRPDIILASGSPRRKKLLADAGYDFSVVVPDVDESAFTSQGISARDYARRLALAKARNVSKSYPSYLVIAADTVVDCNGKIIGKPDSRDAAADILETLFAGPHRVITAFALIWQSRGIEIIDRDSTTIYPRPISHQKLIEYLDSGHWKGKAGAYGINPAGDENIEKIEGSLTNVMGLPMELLEKHISAIKSRLK